MRFSSSRIAPRALTPQAIPTDTCLGAPACSSTPPGARRARRPWGGQQAQRLPAPAPFRAADPAPGLRRFSAPLANALSVGMLEACGMHCAPCWQARCPRLGLAITRFRQCRLPPQRARHSRAAQDARLWLRTRTCAARCTAWRGPSSRTTTAARRRLQTSPFTHRHSWPPRARPCAHRRAYVSYLAHAEARVLSAPVRHTRSAKQGSCCMQVHLVGNFSAVPTRPEASQPRSRLPCQHQHELGSLACLACARPPSPTGSGQNCLAPSHVLHRRRLTSGTASWRLVPAWHWPSLCLALAFTVLLGNLPCKAGPCRAKQGLWARA